MDRSRDARDARATASLNRVAAAATLHCLSGCAIGEIAGLAIGTALGWTALPTIALAVALAFVTGVAATAWPLMRRGFAPRRALAVAFAADAASIALMETVDNALMLAIPGAMDAGLADPVFWGAMTVALAVAGVAAFPLNRWLIARGQGHALAHAEHGPAGHGGAAPADGHAHGSHPARRPPAPDGVRGRTPGRPPPTSTSAS